LDWKGLKIKKSVGNRKIIMSKSDMIIFLFLTLFLM
jgi:hypothetical protein